MMKRISDYKAPIIVLLCWLLLRASFFAFQYFLNPGWLVFVPSPLIVLPLALLLLLFTLSPVFSLAKKKNRTKKTVGVIFANLLVWLLSIVASTLIPHGVAVRLSQFSEQDFQEISGLISSVCEKHRNGAEGFSYGDDGYDRFLQELKESHEIFNLSTFPIGVQKGENFTSIDWSSGLCGGHDVVIFEKSSPPEWLREYRAVYLYDTVAYYEIEDYAF